MSTGSSHAHDTPESQGHAGKPKPVPGALSPCLLVSLSAGLVAALFLLWPGRVLAQGNAPLLYVRFTGPPGMQVGFSQGQRVPREYPAPVVVGLRPGYIYRVRLSGFADRPGLALYPTLEVRGTLHAVGRIRASDHPAPVHLSDVDVERIVNGLFLTKAVYLEDPEKAVAVAGETILEQEVPARADLLEEARSRGRPMLVVRVGQKMLDNDQMAREAVPGTILLPGQTSLPAVRTPPQLPWVCFPYYDPTLGPKPPSEECLTDGGDMGTKAAVDAAGNLRGLEPSDTVATFTDNRGHRRLTCSNRVCLCVPRFAALRSEVPLAGYDVAHGLAGARAVHGQVQHTMRQPSRETEAAEHAQAILGRQRPGGAIASQGLGRITRLEFLQAYHLDLGPAAALGTVGLHRLTDDERLRLARQIEFAQKLSATPQGVRGYEGAEGARAVGNVEGLGVVEGVVQLRDVTVCANKVPEEVPRSQGCPLLIHKWVSTSSAKIGDVVTFYIKYTNLGARPITDVAVSDSLTGRLEYVPGSSKSDRDAVFTTQPNEAGSLMLRWEISGRLLPAGSGVVSFQARIR